MKRKTFFINFKGLLLKYLKTIFLEGESQTLNLDLILEVFSGISCVGISTFLFIADNLVKYLVFLKIYHV